MHLLSATQERHVSDNDAARIVCSTFDKPYKEVAQSWKKVHKNQRDDHFFAQLDFDDGQAVFAKVSLSTIVPVRVTFAYLLLL